MNHLLDRHGGDSGIAIAYIYHDFRNPQKFGSISQVISAIISQLCDRLGEIPDQLMEFSEEHRSAVALRVQHIVWVAEKFQIVHLAIDGLDEWHSTSRGELLGLLLQLRNETSVTIKILITSRFENQISLRLGDCKTIDLVQEADQVTGDVERVMRATVDKMLHGGDLYLQDPTRKGEIVSLLTSKSQGMFVPEIPRINMHMLTGLTAFFGRDWPWRTSVGLVFKQKRTVLLSNAWRHYPAAWTNSTSAFSRGYSNKGSLAT